VSDSQIYIDHDGRRWIVTEILRTRPIAAIDGPGIEYAVIRFESEGDELFARDTSPEREGDQRNTDQLERLFKKAHRA
jgi:hypothetical protein